MAFSGAWRQGAYSVPDAYVSHTADPAHAEVGEDDGTQALTYQAPPQADSVELVAAELPGMEWIAATPGRVLDTTDYTSHEADTRDRGADDAGYYGEPITQFSGEKYEGSRFESFDGVEVNPVVLQRGLNGLPVNNPQGFRNGWVEQFWVDRKFAIGERVNDERVIFPDTAFSETGKGSGPVEAGPYAQPFGSLARAISSINVTPMARREPPPMGGDQVDDGTPYYPAGAYDTWVVG
jgi:hypothetical protein